MHPRNRINFVPFQPLGSILPGPPSLSALRRCPPFEPPPEAAMFRQKFLSLPLDLKYYQALDRLTRQLSTGKGGAMSRQMVTLTCSFSSPKAQDGFWKFLEDYEHVKVPWKAGATLTWTLQKQAGWINFDLWADPKLF
jgi:hypothetical protein